MTSLLLSKYAFIADTVLCAAGFFYGMLVYNKKFNSLKMHRFSVTLVVLLLVYLIFCIFFSVYCFLAGKSISAIVCAVSMFAPFIIGISGNHYSRAKLFYSVQIIALIASAAFFLILL